MFSASAWAEPVAKITAVTGNVVLLSGADIIQVKAPGQLVNSGDNVQTEDGTAQLTFTDGAILKITPYSSSMVQEQEEESGFLFFKTKTSVPRITAFIVKMWHIHSVLNNCA
ncbi:MAG: hypothetical protein ABIL58_00375 [Pseudomonadota bacterium]